MKSFAFVLFASLPIASCANYVDSGPDTPCHDGWITNQFGDSKRHELSAPEISNLGELLGPDRRVICAHDVPPNLLLVINSDGKSKYATTFRGIGDSLEYVGEDYIFSIPH